LRPHKPDKVEMALEGQGGGDGWGTGTYVEGAEKCHGSLARNTGDLSKPGRISLVGSLAEGETLVEPLDLNLRGT
jgi:hypothetical protein